jgi:hypothetical protein
MNRRKVVKVTRRLQPRYQKQKELQTGTAIIYMNQLRKNQFLPATQ